MLLQAQLGVLLEPPWCDLALAYSTEDRQWRRVVSWVVGPLLGQASKVVGKDLCADAQRLDELLGQVNGDLAEH